MRNAATTVLLTSLISTAAAASGPDAPAAVYEPAARLVFRVDFGGVADAARYSLNGLRLGAATDRLAQNDPGIQTEPMDSDVYVIGDEDVPPPDEVETDTRTTTTRDPQTGRTTSTTTSTTSAGWGLTPVQWLGVGAAAIAVGVVIAGTGGGDDEEPRVDASGGN